MKIIVGMLAAALLLAAAGCGKSESEKAREAGRGPITCEGTALSKPTGLPAGFPQPGGVTYVKTAQNGPTVVVNGFGTNDLDATFDAYKSGFESAGCRAQAGRESMRDGNRKRDLSRNSGCRHNEPLFQRPRTVMRVQQPSVNWSPSFSGVGIPGSSGEAFSDVPFVEPSSIATRPPSSRRRIERWRREIPGSATIISG